MNDTKYQQQSMDSIILEIPQKQCKLCLKKCDKVQEICCIEQNLLICIGCIFEISKQKMLFALCNGAFQNREFSFPIIFYQQISIVKFSSLQLYNLQYQTCKICFEENICTKICQNQHYFCFKCLKSYFEFTLNRLIVKCAMEQCDQTIDHYIISLFIYQNFQKWSIFHQNVFCPNTKCKGEIYFSPYQKFNTQVVKIDYYQSQCSFCKTKFCNQCWNEFQGTYNNHFKICNSEKYRDSLLQQYVIANNILQCPKCKFYSQPECPKSKNVIQQCQLCGISYYFNCKSRVLQLFQTKSLQGNNSYYYLDVKRNCVLYTIICFPCVSLFFIGLCLSVIIYCIYLPLQGFFFLGKVSTRYIRNKLSKMNCRLKIYLFYLFFPLVIVFEIVAMFFEYTFKFGPWCRNIFLQFFNITD